MTDTPATVVVALENLRELGIDEDEIYLLKQRVVAVFDAMLAARPALSAAPVGEGGAVETLKARIAELEAQVFVPGLHRCARCGCKTVCNTLNASTGTIRADSKPQDCPNGCGPMWPVTEREAGNEMADRLEALTPREEAPAEAGEGDLRRLLGDAICYGCSRRYGDNSEAAVKAARGCVSCTAARAALRARSSEPVAWRGKLGRDPDRQYWSFCSQDPTGGPGWHSVQPLYTHPAADPDKLRVAREALVAVVIADDHRPRGLGTPSDWIRNSYAPAIAHARKALAALNAEGL